MSTAGSSRFWQYAGQRLGESVFGCWCWCWWGSDWLSLLLLTDWLHSEKWTGSSNAPVYEGKERGREWEGCARPSLIHPLHPLHPPHPPPPASGRRAIPASHPPSIVISSLQYLLLLPATGGLAMTYDTFHWKSLLSAYKSTLLDSSTLIPATTWSAIHLNGIIAQSGQTRHLDLFMWGKANLILQQIIKRCCPDNKF